MPLDLQNPLSGGSVAIAGLLYIGASLYITGPLIAERTIERSSWGAACQALQQAEVRSHEAPPSFTPKLNCRSLLGWMGRDGEAFCNQYGNPSLDLPGLDQLREHQRNLREFRQRQLDARLAQSHSRCACAVTVTLDRHRTSFAVFAGTARLVTPAPLKNFSAELETSLRSPLCTSAGMSGGAS